MTRLAWKTIAPALFLLLALTSCGPAPEGDSQVTTPEVPMPSGVVWRWTALSGSETLEVEQPDRYTIEFMEDGGYGLRADCNSGVGSCTFDGGGLTLEPGPMTMAACGPDSLGTRFAVLLGKVVGYKMDGDRLLLELDDAAGSMLFEEMPRISLLGSSWLVRGYNNGKGGVQSVAADTTLHLEFTDDGVVRGFAGCNTFTASYEVERERLVIGPAAVTRKMCMGGGLMEQEAAFLVALASVTAWQIDGERLRLTTASDALALDLVVR